MSPSDPEPPEDPLARRVAQRAERRKRARKHRARATWFGLGMYGMVGWSIAVPTLVGVAVGLWIDARWPGRFSWALMLLAAGLLVGCWNAWHWVSVEQRAIQGDYREEVEGEDVNEDEDEELRMHE